jgi:cystathionine gamma-lyase
VNTPEFNPGDGTRCVRAGTGEPVAGQPFLAGPVFAAPFHLGDRDPGEVEYSYGRGDNPTWRALESALGELDGGECVLFPSGMGALATVLRTLLRAGDTVLAPADGYFLAGKLFEGELAHLRVRFVPTVGPWTPEVVAGAALVLVETPANPGLDVCDLREVARLAHAAGALLAVDNTTATPLGQRPLELGADLTIGSDTKAVAGHSDVLLGHVTAADPELAGRLRTARTVGGLNPGPFEAWLAHRGLGTLDLRLARQAENAAALYPVLAAHPAVSALRWPGAPADPGHEIAARQMRRFGGVLSFRLADADAVRRFLAASRLFSAATSFGGLHSTADRRAQWGDPVPAGLLRLSCGCEDPADLVADVSAALDAVGSLDQVQSAGRG